MSCLVELDPQIRGLDVGNSVAKLEAKERDCVDAKLAGVEVAELTLERSMCSTSVPRNLLMIVGDDRRRIESGNREWLAGDHVAHT